MANVLSTSRYKNVKLDLTTNTATTLYTCPALMTTFVSSILVSGDILTVTAATANRLHVIASLVEVPKTTTA